MTFGLCDQGVVATDIAQQRWSQICQDMFDNIFARHAWQNHAAVSRHIRSDSRI